MLNSHSHWMQLAGTHGARLIAIVLLALLLIRLLRVGTRRLIQFAKSQSRLAQMREQQTRTMAGVVYSVGIGIIVIVALLAALPELGFNITPVAAAAGLASLAVGFGGQHLVRDLINGFFIIIEDQFVVGEVVRVGTTVGRVEHLTLRRTVIRDVQGAVVSIPNGEIAQVSNLSRDWGQVFVDISIPPETSSDTALAALERVCSELRADVSWSPVLVDGPRALGVDSFGPTGATLRLQLRTVPGRQDDAARELRRRIQNRFDHENIRWGGVQRVEVVGADALQRVTARSNS